jgi:hypothetical protein
MNRRPKIAAIVTEYRKFSHGQHIVDRFLEGYGWNSKHHYPPMDLVSLYVDQVKENDLSRERAARFPQMKLYPTIADALTLGGSDLAVDGVLLIGEHGDYPLNEKGQRLWPRYEMYRQIVSVYRTTGKRAPIFNDKHLSWRWDWAVEMVEKAATAPVAVPAMVAECGSASATEERLAYPSRKQTSKTKERWWCGLWWTLLER